MKAAVLTGSGIEVRDAPKPKPAANQVLVRVSPGSGNADALTRAALARVQQERICWLRSTRWHGMDAMRISVSNWSTTEDDVDRSADSIVRAAKSVSA